MQGSRPGGGGRSYRRLCRGCVDDTQRISEVVRWALRWSRNSFVSSLAGACSPIKGLPKDKSQEGLGPSKDDGQARSLKSAGVGPSSAHWLAAVAARCGVAAAARCVPLPRGARSRGKLARPTIYVQTWSTRPLLDVFYGLPSSSGRSSGSGGRSSDSGGRIGSCLSPQWRLDLLAVALWHCVLCRLD